MAEKNKSLKSAAQTNHPTSNEPLAVDIALKGNAAAKAKMTAVVNEMCLSSAGQMILEEAAGNGYELKFDAQAGKEGLFGFVDPAEESCLLSPKNTIEQNIVTLAHELRHAYQYSYEDLDDVDCRSCSTKSVMHKHRIMEADAESFGCLVAWELKEQGKDGCWKDFSASYPEISEAFEKTLGKTGDLNQARTAAFKGWYDNAERRDYYDQTQVSMLEDTAPEIFKKKLKSVPAAKFVNAFCSDPDTGENYFTGNSSELESGKYVSVYEDIKERMTAHHQKREKAVKGCIADKTVADLPTQKRPPETNEGKAVSQKAKEIAIQAKQARAAGEIRKKKSGSPLVLAAVMKKTNLR